MKVLTLFVVFILWQFIALPVRAQVVGNGDVDANGVVNVTDLKLILAAWNSTGGSSDQWGDGLVNSVDFNLTRTKILAPTITPTPTLTPLQEVSSHNTQANCWTVYAGHVYNVTAYFGLHPGGNGKLLTACGVDMTSKWNGQSLHFSSLFNPSAGQILQNYLLH